VVTRPPTIGTVATGDIWLAQLDPTVGSEIQKTRPCIVVSPPEMNAHLRTVVVAPMTTGSRPAAFRVPITFQGKSGLILLDQVRTLDKSRLLRHEGTAHRATIIRCLTTLQAMFAPHTSP
jgi:mRNA interferase MazF